LYRNRKSGKKAGFDISVPFTLGRVDARQGDIYEKFYSAIES